MAQPTVGIIVIKGAKMHRGYKRRAVKAAMEKVATHVEKEYRKTTATWNHKVRFRKKVAVTDSKAEARVFTDDKQFIGVDAGTSLHPIVPRKAKVLAFQENFTSKTRKRWIGSRPGGKSGAWTYRASVQQRIEAREFTPTIAKQAQPVMDKEMTHAMSKQIFPHHRGGSR